MRFYEGLGLVLMNYVCLYILYENDVYIITQLQVIEQNMQIMLMGRGVWQRAALIYPKVGD